MSILLKPLFQDISDAIRYKDGSTGKIYPKDFADRIRAIPTGDNEIVLESLVILTPPTKTDYYYNGLFAETFKSDGMTYQATLTAFGTSLQLPVDETYVTLSPTGELNQDVTAIIAIFKFGSQSVSAQQPINVSYRSPSWHDVEYNNLTWESLNTRFDSWNALENG